MDTMAGRNISDAYPVSFNAKGRERSTSEVAQPILTADSAPNTFQNVMNSQPDHVHFQSGWPDPKTQNARELPFLN